MVCEDVVDGGVAPLRAGGEVPESAMAVEWQAGLREWPVVAQGKENAGAERQKPGVEEGEEWGKGKASHEKVGERAGKGWVVKKRKGTTVEGDGTREERVRE